MTRIFLSHVSQDHGFVSKLANHLSDLGHEPWFDEWEVRVGDEIVQKTEHGLTASDYVVVVLTPAAVDSGWVEREWHAKFWDGIEQDRTVVLPVMLKSCSVPSLLMSKKYADFRHAYETGLVRLMAAIDPVSSKTGLERPAPEQRFSGRTGQVASQILADLHSRSVSVAHCVVSNEQLPFVQAESVG